MTLAPEQLEPISIELPKRLTWRTFPYWLVAILGFVVVMAVQILFGEEFTKAFDFIIGGLGLTLYASALAFVISMFIGLIAAVARMSKSVIARNIATTYIEFIRGVPMLVLLVTFGIVLVPDMLELVGLDRRLFDLTHRGIIGLSAVYGAFLAEVFRAGIESIPKGQTEAARSLGMTKAQTMQRIVIPQAIRNILPALGNDFIALLKDSALLSILAIREMTQMTKLYTGSSFRFDEGYLVLTFVYLSLTLILSLLVQWYGRRIGTVSTSR
ncbi:MAG: amino acid ABC transporter permease [Actinomycetota bacterium]|nr:amino acid ABC transporter permease [Actinomycetota bacterium]